MKSKRRILVGDCSELYRKKKDRRVNLEFHVDEGLKDRLALMISGSGFLPPGELPNSNRPVYFNGVYITTQTGPPDELDSSNYRNVIQVPSGGFRTGDVVFLTPNGNYTTTRPTEGYAQPIGIALDSTRIALSGSSRLPDTPVLPPDDHNIEIIESVRWDVPRYTLVRNTMQSPPELEEDTRPVRYVVHPGAVTSVYDGGDHFISYARLIELYQVSATHCKSSLLPHLPAWTEEYRIVHLYPLESGYYVLPERDRRT
jgi:hypothetical protein